MTLLFIASPNRSSKTILKGSNGYQTLITPNDAQSVHSDLRWSPIGVLTSRDLFIPEAL